MDPKLERLARSLVDALGVDREPQLHGIGDFLESAGTWIKDNALPIAEVVVPAIAPYTAPIFAAEHAIRTGQLLNHDQAKAATTAATKIGTAVAATQGVVVAPSEEHTDPQPERHTEELHESASSPSSPPSSRSSATPWIIGAALAALALL